MRVTVWGTRGSVTSAGPETVRYGGNTSCVEVRNAAGALVVLDAGTGIRRLGATVGPETKRVDCLLYTSPSPRDGLLSRMPSSA